MTSHQDPERSDATTLVAPFPVAAMLEARSIAVVGASARPGSFGERMVEEVTRSPSRPDIYLVNPRYDQLAGRPCLPSLAELPGPVDLVLLAVPDAALEQQLALAAARGDRSAVIFGNAHEDPVPLDPGLPAPSPAPDPCLPAPSPAPDPGLPAPPPSPDPGLPAPPPSPDPGLPAPPPSPDPGSWLDRNARFNVPNGPTTGRAADGPGLRERLAVIARSAGMQLCGAGCMGFINVAHGVRAIGYTEPYPAPAGPVALITHSGSVFSAMLRVRRAIGYSLVVSSGQELVTTAPAYLDYALGLPETRVLGLVLEAIRDPAALHQVLARAAERSLPVVLLTAGNSASGRMMVAAHSGALAADDGGWEALARRYGIHRVSNLAEFSDSLEVFSIGRRVRRADQAAPGAGIATVHDSGLERAHAADVAEEVGVPYAAISETTKARLADILDPGLIPANPLDVWGTGADTRTLFARSLLTLAADPSVSAVALAVDMIRELDGDLSYPQAVLEAASQTTKPVVVLSNVASAIDPEYATELRQQGVPVLEGMRTGLLALRHLLDHAARSPGPAGRSDGARPAGAAGPGALRSSRRDRGAALLAADPADGAPLLALLREYGIATAAAQQADDADGALAAAAAVGYPVVLKTAEPAITHKSDAGGVVLGIGGPAELAAAYADLATRLGPRVLVCETVPAGTELALGIARDPDLGPLIVVGAGGVLVELLADRAVALPPVDAGTARQMIAELRLARLLAGIRGAPPADLDAVVRAITGLSELAVDLGDEIEALDVNPLICGPSGATAVDVLTITRARAG
jgi:acyl-CoA synthetase (NDP forming)